MRFLPSRRSDEIDRLQAELATYRHAFETTVADRDRIAAELKDLKRVYQKAIDAGLWPQAATLEEQQRRIDEGIRSVLLLAMPRSGGLFLSRALSMTLKFQPFPVAHPLAGMMNDALLVNNFELFAHGGLLAQHRLAPSQHNIALLQKHGIQPLLHVRDPRQAAVSWWYHGVLLGHIDPVKTERRSLIESFIKPSVSWVSGWLESGIELHLSSQEDLARDEMAVIESMLAFTGQPERKILLPERPQTKNFRWAAFFDGDLPGVVPDALAERFGW